MVFVSHREAPADVLRALRERGTEVSPWVVYRDDDQDEGAIYDMDADEAINIARSAQRGINYEFIGSGAADIQGVRFSGDVVIDEVEDEEVDPFDDDEDNEDEITYQEYLERRYRTTLARAVEVGLIGRFTRDIRLDSMRSQAEQVNTGEVTSGEYLDWLSTRSNTLATHIGNLLTRQAEQAAEAAEDTAETDTPSTEEESPVDTVQATPEAVAQPTSQPITVRKESWSNRAGYDTYQDFRPLFSEFAGKVQMPVSVHVPHGYPTEYTPFETFDDGRLHIMIWSAPGVEDKTPATNRVMKVFDHGLDLMDTGFLGENVAERYPQMLGVIGGAEYSEGHDGPTAFVFDDALFITYDAVHNERDLPALREVLNRAAEIYDEDEEQRAERRAAALREAQERKVNRYVEVVKNRALGEYNRLKTEYEEANVTIEQLTERLVSYRRRFNNLGRQIAGWDPDAVIDTEAYKKEFFKLLNLPKVRDAEVEENGTFVIRTENLYAFSENTDTWHDIGEFRIVINPSNAQIRWHNQTRQVQGYNTRMQAPHVFEDGKACLGNFSEIVASLMPQYELATLATMAIAFVEEANPNDSAGRHVVNWPEVDEPTAMQFESN